MPAFDTPLGTAFCALRRLRRSEFSLCKGAPAGLSPDPVSLSLASDALY
jgi:hypothetical protein